MLRLIGGVIVGYVVMAAFVMVTFSVAYLIMGADGAFQPDSYKPSALWLVTSFVLGIIGALVAGLVSALVAGPRGPAVLAVIVLILGLVMAIPALKSSEDGIEEQRTGAVSNFEAMSKAKTPAWVALLNPLLGAGGILLGGRLRRAA